MNIHMHIFCGGMFPIQLDKYRAAQLLDHMVILYLALSERKGIIFKNNFHANVLWPYQKSAIVPFYRDG